MFRSIVYLTSEKDLSAYISLCVASLRDLLVHQLVDMIAINIHSNTNDRLSPILRRYLIEFHPIEDPCLRAIYDNTKELIQQLDRLFAQTIRSIQRIEPVQRNAAENFDKKWTFQLRLSSESKTKKLGEILKDQPIYKEFLLINEQAALLSNGKDSLISQIKSFHCERLHLQLLCEDDQYEQKIFQQSRRPIKDDDTDYESDSDLFDRPARPTDDPSKTKGDANPSETLFDRYHLTEINREQNDVLQYLSEDEQDDEDAQSDDEATPIRAHRQDENEENTDEDDF